MRGRREGSKILEWEVALWIHQLSIVFHISEPLPPVGFAGQRQTCACIPSHGNQCENFMRIQLVDIRLS